MRTSSFGAGIGGRRHPRGSEDADQRNAIADSPEQATRDAVAVPWRVVVECRCCLENDHTASGASDHSSAAGSQGAEMDASPWKQDPSVEALVAPARRIHSGQADLTSSAQGSRHRLTKAYSQWGAAHWAQMWRRLPPVRRDQIILRIESAHPTCRGVRDIACTRCCHPPPPQHRDLLSARSQKPSFAMHIPRAFRRTCLPFIQLRWDP